MNKNLNLIAKELFAKIRTSFPEISLKDKESETTGKPSEARFFDFDYAIDGQNLGRITIHLAEKDEDEDGDKDGLTIILRLFIQKIRRRQHDRKQTIWHKQN